MPEAEEVKPKKWDDIRVLFDDGVYSACWGKYDGAKHYSLGVRWNEGYPSQGGNPLWYVEPEFTTKGILESIVGMHCKYSGRQPRRFLNNTLEALEQFLNQEKEGHQ